ncbi:MAG TPA: hypothetical protein VFG50_06150 [Rhodothermales bacterium]|nr:hypothetical protein [Rhodothermales bacterium]
MKQVLSITAVLTLFFALQGTTQEIQAQPMGYNLGIGGQLGDPSGLSIKYYRSNAGGSLNFRAWDLLLAWDLGNDDYDRLFVNLHGEFERPLSDIPLKFFYGPGIFVGIVDFENRDSRFYAGISGDFGLAYEIDRFDIFGRLTPRLALVPDTNGDLGGGIGVRFWF